MSRNLLTVLLICAMLLASSVCCCAFAGPQHPDGKRSCCAANVSDPEPSCPDDSKHCPCSKQEMTAAAATRDCQLQLSLRGFTASAIDNCHSPDAKPRKAGSICILIRRHSPDSPSGMDLLQRIRVNRC